MFYEDRKMPRISQNFMFCEVKKIEIKLRELRAFFTQYELYNNLRDKSNVFFTD